VAGSKAGGGLRGRAGYTSQAAVAYLTLLRGDTADAIRRFETLPGSLCPFCYFDRLTLAQLLSSRRGDRKAAQLLDGVLIESLLPSEVLWTLEITSTSRTSGATPMPSFSPMWPRRERAWCGCPPSRNPASSHQSAAPSGLRCLPRARAGRYGPTGSVVGRSAMICL
jgi:hypothetical protein